MSTAEDRAHDAWVDAHTRCGILGCSESLASCPGHTDDEVLADLIEGELGVNGPATVERLREAGVILELGDS